jgi:hypothetical protein
MAAHVIERSSTVCEVCGNDYDKPIHVEQYGIHHTFDCLQCAIQALAPRCAHCGCRMIGHGVEHGSVMFCSAHCGREAGRKEFVDRGDIVVLA